VKRKTAYFNSKAQTIINITGLNQQLKMAKEEIRKKIEAWLSEGSGWMVDKINDHYLNIIKYKPLKGKSYFQLPKEIRHPMKGLINVQNKDNECFRWCRIRYIEIGRHRTRKKNYEPARGLERIVVSKIKKACVGEGGKCEGALDDTFGIR